MVVCGRSADADRIGTVPDYSRPFTLPRARTDIPGVGTLSAETEQAGVGGFPSNRAMIRLKIPWAVVASHDRPVPETRQRPNSGFSWRH
ncbi:hypothetical protein P0F65_08150 [Sphingomonas sp. I4]